MICLGIVFYALGGQNLRCDTAVQHGWEHHTVYKFSRCVLWYLQVCWKYYTIYSLLCRVKGYPQSWQSMSH